MTSQLTKKQHLVPQCYLQWFAIRDRLQVYDKTQNRFFLINKRDAASRSYFYDVNSPFTKENYDVQFAEHTLSKIEGELSPALDEFHFRLKGNKPLYPEQKTIISALIAIQIFRTQEFREICLKFVRQVKEEFPHEKDQIEGDNPVLEEDDVIAKLVQLDYVFNNEVLDKLTSFLDSCIWLIASNKTKIPFFTSDNPVSIKGINGKLDYSKVLSRGTQISLPLSEKYLLILCEKQYFQSMLSYDLRKISMQKQMHVLEYNNLQLIRNRINYSINGHQ